MVLMLQNRKCSTNLLPSKMFLFVALAILFIVSFKTVVYTKVVLGCSKESLVFDF